MVLMADAKMLAGRKCLGRLLSEACRSPEDSETESLAASLCRLKGHSGYADIA